MLEAAGSLFGMIQALDSRLRSTAAGYFMRLYAGFYVISIVSSLWVYGVARKLPAGGYRAAACLPVVLMLLAATPVLVDRTVTPVLIVPVCGTFSLAAFKVAAFAVGRGPLAMQHCRWARNLLQFGVVLSLPVIPRDAFKLGAGASLSDVSSLPPATWSTFAKLYGAKSAGAIVAASLAIWHVLPELLRHWFYALCLSLTLGALWDFWCLIAVVFADIPVAPSFDQPWLSTSFADYWSRRWNLTTAYLLRVLVYEPVREGRLVPASAPPAPAAPAALAAPTAPAAPATAKATALKDAALTCNVPVSQSAAAPAGPDEDMADSSSMKAGLQPQPRPAVTVTADSSSSSSDGSPSSSRSSSGKIATTPAHPDTLDPTGAGRAQNERHDDAKAPATTARSRRKETAAQAIMRRVAATCATFIFSGLWHMLIFYYATGLVTYHWLAFFSLQGPIMVVEALLKHWAKRVGFQLPKPVAVFLTNFLLIVVANPLFFGPCDWSGMCSAMMDNVKGGLVITIMMSPNQYLARWKLT